MATSLSWCKFAIKKVLKERQTRLISILLAEKKTKKLLNFQTVHKMIGHFRDWKEGRIRLRETDKKR